MRIGVPKEIKVDEYRVGITPENVGELVHAGHSVVVESGAGSGIGADDEAYQNVGADVRTSPEEVFGEADLVVKVKEPQPNEYAFLRRGQILFTYLHLAADPPQARALQQSGCTAIAYETVTDDQGGLPLLAPMSAVAGRLATLAAAHHLQRPYGGLGVLIGGVPGVFPARVVILGAGTVGTHATAMALGLGAEVTLLNRSTPRLDALDRWYQGRVRTGVATQAAIAEALRHADAVIGAVLVPGASAPRLITRDMLSSMRAGSVIVDVAIDQGGCCETSRPTTHAQPVFEVDRVIHYCVANMPGAVPRTSTYALGNATLPFIKLLADLGENALRENLHLRQGLSVFKGEITCRPVAEALRASFRAPDTLLSG